MQLFLFYINAFGPEIDALESRASLSTDICFGVKAVKYLNLENLRNYCGSPIYHSLSINDRCVEICGEYIIVNAVRNLSNDIDPTAKVRFPETPALKDLPP